ncbi:ABC transporter permease [Clostridia bacterium]|nr:ABC transporter permease [Clostridia bacterium]
MKSAMKKSYRYIALVLAILMIGALALAGCNKSEPAAGSSAAPAAGSSEAAEEPEVTGPPIKIGLLNETSGAYEQWGKMELQGFFSGLYYATDGTMAIDGRPLEVIVEDTTCDVGVGVQKATKLLEDDKVDILSGTCISSIALAVMDMAAEKGVPYVINCAASDDITGANFNEYTFRTGRNLTMAAEAGLGFLNEDEIEGTTWVVLAPDYAGGRSGGESLGAGVEARGGKVLDYIYPPMDCTDFTSYIQKIKSLNPDYLCAAIVGNNFIVKFPQQLKELGALDNGMQYVTSIADFDFLKTVGEAGIGQIGEALYHYNCWDTPANDALIQIHQELYNGEYPDFWAGESFVGAQAIVLGIQKAGGTDGQAFIKALEGLEFESVKGTYIIRAEDHQALQPMAVGRIISDGNGGATVEAAAIIPLEGMTFPVTAPGRA